MYTIAAMNSAVLLPAAGFSALIYFLPWAALKIAAFVLAVFLCALLLSAVSRLVCRISDYRSIALRDLPKALSEGIRPGIAAGFIMLFYVSVVFIAVPSYVKESTGTAGFALGAFCVWTVMILLITFQFLFSAGFRIGGPVIKIIKKLFLIFFDNPAFCLIVFFSSLLCAAVSALTFFIFPGPAGILLFIDESFRLRLLKYDYPEVSWEERLLPEREKIGNRKFSDLIFPWK